MIKIKLAFVFLLVLFVSCQRKEPKPTQVKPVYLAYDSEWNIDTLTHNDIYNADTISSKAFNLLSDENIEDKETIDDYKNVKRKDSVLILKLSFLKRKKLINNSKNGGNYFYLKNVPELNSWLIKCYANDEHEHLMYVNKNSGKETHFYRKSTLSPNKKYLICYGTSCTDFSNITLYRNEKDCLTNVWTKRFDNLGPESTKWKNDTTLFLKMKRICLENSGEISYIKLSIGKYLKK